MRTVVFEAAQYGHKAGDLSCCMFWEHHTTRPISHSSVVCSSWPSEPEFEGSLLGRTSETGAIYGWYARKRVLASLFLPKIAAAAPAVNAH